MSHAVSYVMQLSHRSSTYGLADAASSPNPRGYVHISALLHVMNDSFVERPRKARPKRGIETERIRSISGRKISIRPSHRIEVAVGSRVVEVRQVCIPQHEQKRPRTSTHVHAMTLVQCRVGFVGLGAMGSGMASTLARKGFHVRGYDVFPEGTNPTRAFEGGVMRSDSPEDAARDAKVVVLAVVNAQQADEAIFGAHGIARSVLQGSTIVLCSTVAPGYVRGLAERLRREEVECNLVDAPMSGGTVRASRGELTVIAAGSDKALGEAAPVLEAMASAVHVVRGGVGAASTVKLVNQLLAGSHIAAAAEAMAFAARAGADTTQVYNIIVGAAGNSWMFENRVPHMLQADYKPHSALDIFVKDLGLVLDEGKKMAFPLPLASTAHQQFLMGSAAGFGKEDDAGLVRVFEKIAGIQVKSDQYVRREENCSLADVLAAAPDPDPKGALEEIRVQLGAPNTKKLVVLDDDPTGTQTVHNIHVLMRWDIATLEEELICSKPGFYILTNSRSLPAAEASALIEEICSNVKEAAQKVGIEFSIVLRGDSTLRGHYPEEADAVGQVLGQPDITILCPFFEAGGRYTVNDIHYVADGDTLVPCANTEFAQDKSFGYLNSNMKMWVEEKTNGKVKASDVASISIEDIRTKSSTGVASMMLAMKKGTVAIVNALNDRDLQVVACAVMKVEAAGLHVLSRTGASFVSARLGLEIRQPILPSELHFETWNGTTGGLIVCGSYVPKSSLQIESLIRGRSGSLEVLQLHVEHALRSDDYQHILSDIVRRADVALSKGVDVLILTSRKLVAGVSKSESLTINAQVSSALVGVVHALQTRPRYVLAKGGITSSDTCQKAIGATDAMVLGQADKGVPLWQLGGDGKWPHLHYIVFPGNVGSVDAILEVVTRWSLPPKTNLKDMLLDASKNGYAIGAFNVYDLVGVRAVVDTAENCRSPAILQIHPTVLKHAGRTLVDACLSAARSAAVPIAVLMDHASTEETQLSMCYGMDAVLADNSSLSFEANIEETSWECHLAHEHGMFVEGELGRISGNEDGIAVEERLAALTNPGQALEFVQRTGVDFLAVCVGNVHGKYGPGGPKIDLELLRSIRECVPDHVPLVLHGASGLDPELLQSCIAAGVAKFNVNTELRQAYVDHLSAFCTGDLLDALSGARAAMSEVVARKMAAFGSCNRVPV